MADRIYLPKVALIQVRELVKTFGLRPVVDAVGAVAVMLVEDGETVCNEYGEAMDEDDIRTAAAVLRDGDLY